MVPAITVATSVMVLCEKVAALAIVGTVLTTADPVLPGGKEYLKKGKNMINEVLPPRIIAKFSEFDGLGLL